MSLQKDLLAQIKQEEAEGNVRLFTDLSPKLQEKIKNGGSMEIIAINQGLTALKKFLEAF